jgi:hypothetical protein
LILHIATSALSWIGTGARWTSAPVAIVAVYSALHATAAGARLPTWRLAFRAVITRRRQRASLAAADPHAGIARSAVAWGLAAIFLAVGGWGFQDGGPHCACALPGPVYTNSEFN